MNRTISFFLLAVIPLPLHAYIGPGMGGGVIAVTIGFVAAIFLALLGILYYPVKRALKNKKNKKSRANATKK